MYCSHPDVHLSPSTFCNRRASALHKESSEEGKSSEARNAIQQQLSRKSSSGRIGPLAATSGMSNGEFGLAGMPQRLQSHHYLPISAAVIDPSHLYASSKAANQCMIRGPHCTGVYICVCVCIELYIEDILMVKRLQISFIS